jgi:O-succinylbenzoic acid--CoA ligase
MTNRLVVIDMPAGPGFVDALTRTWDNGDAAFPIDQRLPRPARDGLLAELAPSSVIGADGHEHALPRDIVPTSRLVEPGDALVVATSGATGEPKGVVLTHDAVAASARATSSRLNVTETDHWLACLPLSHVGGLAVVARALVTGTRLTVLPGFESMEVDRMTAESARRADKPTLVSLVATALARIDPSRFRVIVLGGSVPPTDVPPNTVVTYGMTESGSGVVYDGVPLDGVDVRIADDGEVHLRGPMLLRAYRRADGDVDPLDDQWLATGDVGRWLPDGRLHVEGRRSDLIISGGENVWPEPVERALRTHPRVADVAVAGTPDPEWGHVVTAYVVPAGGQPPELDELRRTVREQLPAYCAPRLLRLVPTIPKTSLGKPRRSALPPR